jgi:salicylate hydroxylase
LAQKRQPLYLIVGAGIGGLALALALLRAGRKVRILESATQLGEVGAGISISPNAALAMNYLGMAAFLDEHADCPTRSAVIHFKTGNILTEVEFGTDFVERYGAKYYQIHRADLHNALVGAVQDIDSQCISLECSVAEVRQTQTEVTVHCQNGVDIRGDYLIGCDGLRSTVRAALGVATPPLWTGQVAYRATLPVAAVQGALKGPPSAVTVGPGHIVVRYLMRHGAMVNLVSIAQSPAWTEEGWNHPSTTQEMLDEHKGWNADVIELIKAAPPENIFKWALFDRDPLASWTDNNVTLLGDAAHPMLPFLGMGAAMALEDAVVLARCVDAYDDTRVAFSRYEAARRERANAAVLASRTHGRMLQSSDPDRQNYGNRKAGDGEEWSRYRYNPATVEI